MTKLERLENALKELKKKARRSPDLGISMLELYQHMAIVHECLIEALERKQSDLPRETQNEK